MRAAAFQAADPAGRLRVTRALVRDLAALEAFIAAYTGDGTLLPRTLANLRAHRGDFRLVWDSDRLVGCGALQRVDATLAEVRSLAVHPEWQGAGLGSMLVRALLRDAARARIQRVFCLTRRVEFFARLGFVVVPTATFPHKIWNDCRLCPRFDHCDEVAMQRWVPAAITTPAKEEGTWRTHPRGRRTGRSLGKSTS
jgi:amino-acid N-acetyltransferase